jgi:lipopolysaccharide export system permease protein
MRLLDRYLLRELLVPLFYCLVGFQIFWLAFDLFGNLQSYQNHNLGWRNIIEITLLRVPHFLTMVLPIALLLSLLYTLTNLVRHNELMAMRAAGVSLARLCAPFFVVALLLGGAVFVATEYLFPNAHEKSERIYNTGQADADRWMEQPVTFCNEALGQTWHIKRYNLATGEMDQPSIEWSTGSTSNVLNAQRGQWANGAWVFYNVEILIYEPATNALPSRVVTNSVFTDRRVGGTPEELKLEIKIDRLSQREAAKSLTLSLAEILEYWKLHPGLEGKKAAQVMTQFHGRIAQPFTCLVVVLVALPFGATSGRRNLFAGVAGSVGICFVYFILQRWCLAFGTGDLMHPILAAWLPNFVFAATGLIFLQMRETQSLELGRWLRSFAKPVSSKAS